MKSIALLVAWVILLVLAIRTGLWPFWLATGFIGGMIFMGIQIAIAMARAEQIQEQLQAEAAQIALAQIQAQMNQPLQVLPDNVVQFPTHPEDS